MKKTMKHRRWVLWLLGLLMLPTVAVADNDKVIETEQLPAAARTTLSKYFRGKEIAVVTMDTEMFGKSYDVVFADGDKIEFNKKGEWKEIKCKNSSVPANLVPTKIMYQVKKRYPAQKIIGMEIDKDGYEVKLSSGLEIKFNKKFKVVEIDLPPSKAEGPVGRNIPSTGSSLYIVVSIAVISSCRNLLRIHHGRMSAKPWHWGQHFSHNTRCLVTRIFLTAR